MEGQITTEVVVIGFKMVSHHLMKKKQQLEL
jgi:hypothetical protein